MPTINYQGKEISAEEGTTVLESLLKNDFNIQHSCKSGICQSCLLRTDAALDLVAQKGLKEARKKQGVFFSCQQKVMQDMKLFDCSESGNTTAATIVTQEHLSSSVVKIQVKIKDEKFSYLPGQFVNLSRFDGLCRSYSIARKSAEHTVDFHVRRVQDGQMSTWLYEKKLVGEELKLNGPVGECFYQRSYTDQDLLLAGTGTGLAPLYGILLDAIKDGHKVAINLFHGGLNEDGLYLVEELQRLEATHSNFRYIPAVLKGDAERVTIGNITDVVKAYNFDANKTVAFICGDPGIVKSLKESVFLAGVASSKIFSDPFITQEGL